MHSLLPLTLLLGLTAKVHCANRFITPGASGSTGWRNNPSYEEGDSMNVEWETDLDETALLLWQDYPLAGGGSQCTIWTVSFAGFTTNTTDGQDAVFHFALYAADNTNDAIANSQNFNVSVPDVDPTTTATDVSTTLAPSPTPTSAEEAETTTAPPAETSDADSGDGGDSGLSSGAVAGVAVGATLGGVAILGGLGFLLWRHFRKGDASGTYAPAAPQAPAQEYYKPPDAPAEMAGAPWVHPPEGPNSNYARGPGGLHEAP
ncbi:hypothetical protein ACJ41O_000729 [Fusarium nematophilum]